MKLSKILAGSAVLVTGALVLANHVPVPLSSIFGGNVLTNVKYYTIDGSVGVPAYVLGAEVEDDAGDDHGGFPLADGDAFSLSDGTFTDVIVFSADDFEHIDDATQDEIVAVINAQTDLASARVDNGHIVMEGRVGGAEAVLAVANVTNVPLSVLDIDAGSVTGEDDITLTISTPAEVDHDHGGDDHAGSAFAHHPYVVVASTTLGEIEVDGQHIPVGFDATLINSIRATQFGYLPTFVGELDDNGDAVAVFETELLEPLFGRSLPAELYFAYVVLSEDGDHVEFASNRFTVEIE